MSNEIKVNDVEYAPKQATSQPAQTLDGMPYVIVRSRDAATFAGYMKSRDGREVELLKARRIWFWEGAATLSQLAQTGTAKPDLCKFPQEVDRVQLLEACEILSCTEEARLSIASVKNWVES